MQILPKEFFERYYVFMGKKSKILDTEKFPRQWEKESWFIMRFSNLPAGWYIVAMNDQKIRLVKKEKDSAVQYSLNKYFSTQGVPIHILGTSKIAVNKS